MISFILFLNLISAVQNQIFYRPSPAIEVPEGVEIPFPSEIFNPPSADLSVNASSFSPWQSLRVCPIGTWKMDLVKIGDPNNPGISGHTGEDSGQVTYEYHMSKYEITNAQYAYFLNMVAAKEDPHHLFKDEMQSSARGGITRWVQTNGRFCYVAKSFMTDKPVNHITFYDVARFTNWLENWERTQNPIGATTEKGTYNMADPLLYINNQSRNPKAIWALPNGNEWLKAAYYDHGVYHFFAAGLGDEPFFGGATPTGQMSPSGFNFANYAAAANWPSGMTGGNVVSVGSAGGMSAYGVSDMNGNVYELTEQVVCLANLCGRDVRGGSYASNHSGFSNGIPLVSGLLIFYAYIWDGLDPSNNPGPIAYTDTMGFRVVKLH